MILRWLPRLMRVVVVANGAMLVLFALAFAIPLPDRGGARSVVVEYRDGEPAYVFLSADDKWRLDVELARVDPRYVEALVALEDKRFWSHDGVDPIAIGRAALSDLTHLRRISGGSTLSMQLARMLEPRSRTFAHKVLDMFRATQLELRLSKREILAEYLAHVPYGGNVEGLESAVRAYFGHSAMHLTPVEIATLLAVPQGPAHFAPKPANTQRLRARRDEILAKLIAADVFSATDASVALDEARTTPPPEQLRRPPREAMHAAVELRAQHPGETVIRSTLDAGVQRLVERQIAQRTTEQRQRGINAGAVVVVDHATREVVALAVSGTDIPMFDRRRSPGSTLKPVLYALAIDRGLALPQFLVADVPSQYGSYRPRNFDGDWAGLVTLRDALARSLNLPFIELLEQFGVARFATDLAQMGVHALAPEQLGLSLIVGGTELTPLELAGLYATLAENGSAQPLRLVRGVAPPAKQVYGPGAAYLTREALSQRDRPDISHRRDVPPAIHWKTGTSYGSRDAWSAGSGPTYTAVVWAGNVDERPSADLTGSEAAAPLLFDILEGLGTRGPQEQRPDELAEIEVCAYSGHLPTDACHDRVKIRAPLHAVPTTPCPYHQAFDVDRESHKAVASACRVAGRDYDRQTFVVLPSSVTAWLTARNRELPVAPELDPACSVDFGPPSIVSPAEGATISLVPGVPTKSQQIALAASTRAALVSWFVDGALVGTGASSERLFWIPTPGQHEVVVADDAGRKARRTLVVRQGRR